MDTLNLIEKDGRMFLHTPEGIDWDIASLIQARTILQELGYEWKEHFGRWNRLYGPSEYPDYYAGAVQMIADQMDNLGRSLTRFGKQSQESLIEQSKYVPMRLKNNREER